MFAGIQIHNDWGTVQVDAEWAAMSLRHKTQIVVSTPAGHAFDGVATFPAKAPLVFWKSDAPIFVLTSRDNGDGTWSYTFRATEPTVTMVYVFDTPEWATQNYGFEIFNAQGEKVFGDHLSPLKLAAVFPIGAVPFVMDDDVSPLPYGNYAVALSDPGFKFETYYEEVPKTAVWSCGAKERLRGGQCDWVLARDGFPVEMPNAVAYPAKYLLVADVGGL